MPSLDPTWLIRYESIQHSSITIVIWLSISCVIEYTYLVMFRWNQVGIFLTVYFMSLSSLLRQNGVIVLDHESERLLGLHILQFPEVGKMNSLCCFWALNWRLDISLLKWTGIFALYFIIQKDTLVHIRALCIVWFFRFLRRHAAIYCLVCCVITSIPWQKSLRKSSILIVRYTSEAVILCHIFKFMWLFDSYFPVMRSA